MREELVENPEKAFIGNEKYKFGQDALAYPRVCSLERSGVRARAREQRGDRPAEIRGAGEGRGRAPAGGGLPVAQTGRVPRPQGQRCWVVEDAGKEGMARW
jgi:hypothetical protein